MRTPLPDGTTDASVPTPEPPAPASDPARTGGSSPC